MNPNNTNFDPELNDLLTITHTTDQNNTRALELLDALDELSDDEYVVPVPRAPRRYLYRDREGRARAQYNDYFSDNPTFPRDVFRRRYRISKTLFLRICQDILNFSQTPIPEYFTYFRQRRDATGLLGFNIVQKITSAIRQLAYATSADLFDEYLHMEVASYDGWFWHAYFGPSGSNNDINVLNQSDLFTDLLAGEAPPCTFTVNGCTFSKGYYLADGIYQEWATLVKSFRNSIDPKQSKFSKYQSSARKDIERAFGILQGRWAITMVVHFVDSRRIIVRYDVHEEHSMKESNNICGYADLRDVNIHRLLRDMLVEHVYNLPHNYRTRHDLTINPNNQFETAPSHIPDDEKEGQDQEEGED
ncbi:uncharacterized protein [Rutidosis leptorrhynchoides]|uniref:uncharacterized protein n=1 Tax=Rutidosis leptorrhynchoides TaxID=125765 RepID=UPI003A99025E